MPNNDYIKRSDALKELYRDAKATDPMLMIAYRVDINERIEKIPAADVEPVVRCRDCKYKPTAPEGITEGFQVEFPYEFDNPCPCKCGDGWYSQKPSDNFFCAYGAKMDAEPPKGGNDAD